MKEWLQDPRLLWAIGVTLFGVVVTACWKCAGWWFDHSHKHTRIDELLAEIKADISNFKAEVKADMNELRVDIKALLGREPTIADAGSPLHLNELGRKVSSYVNAKEIAKKEAPNVKELLPSLNPYDIQAFCKQHFAKDGGFVPTSDQLDIFKQCAFDHGIKLEQVRYVCAIELRDELRILIQNETP